MNLETAMRSSFSALRRSFFSLLLVSVLAACGSFNVEAEDPQNQNLDS